MTQQVKNIIDNDRYVGESLLNINSVHRDGNTGLCLAVANGHVDVVRHLLTQPNININQPNTQGYTPFMLACSRRRTDIVRSLLGHVGLDIYRKDCNGRSPLSLLWFNTCNNYDASHNDVLTLLLERINNDHHEFRGLLVKLYKCSPSKIMQALLGKDENRNTNTSITACVDTCMQAGLEAACEKGNHDLVNDLLSCGNVNVNAVNESGSTCLHMACRKHLPNVVKRLIAHPKIRVNMLDKDGNTPLHNACVYGWREDESKQETIVALLKHKKVQLNIPNKKGETPLYVAFRKGYGAIARLLKDHGACVTDINARNERGKTLLHIAAEENYKSIAKMLLTDQSIDVNLLDEAKHTALYTACTKRYPYIVELLLAHPKIKPNIPDEHGHHLLHFVVRSVREAYNYHHNYRHKNREKDKENNQKILEALLAHPAIEVNSFDEHNHTPLLIAIHERNDKAIVALLNHRSTDVNKCYENEYCPLAVACRCHLNKVLVTQFLTHPHLDIANVPFRYLRALYESHTEQITNLLLYTNAVDNEPEEKGNGINPNANLLLSLACQLGYDKQVALLLTREDIDVNALSPEGNTPLTIAAANLCDAGVYEEEELYEEGSVNSSFSEQSSEMKEDIPICSHEKTMRLLFKHPAIDINAPNSEGATALSIACEKKCTLLADQLFTHPKLDITLIDNYNLYHVYVYNTEKVVKTLLEPEFNKQKHAVDYATKLLCLACRAGHIETVRWLLKHRKIDINSKKDGNAPLFVAVYAKHLTIIKELLTHSKIDINILNENGNTPLTIACADNALDIITLLLNNPNVDPHVLNQDNDSPFDIFMQGVERQEEEDDSDAIYTVELADKHNVEALFFQHNRINIARMDKALLYKMHKYNPEGIIAYLANAQHAIPSKVLEDLFTVAYKTQDESLLLQLLDIMDSSHIDGNFLYSLYASGQNYETVIQLLLTHKLTPIDQSSWLDSHGDELLPIACSKGDAILVRQLLHHPQVQLTNELGKKLLDKACKAGAYHVVELLINDKRIDLPAIGYSLLEIACKNGYMAIVSSLLDALTVHIFSSSAEQQEFKRNDDQYDTLDLTRENLAYQLIRVAYEKNQVNIAKNLLAHHHFPINRTQWLAACGDPLMQIFFDPKDFKALTLLLNYPAIDDIEIAPFYPLVLDTICSCGHKETVALLLNIPQQDKKLDYDLLLHVIGQGKHMGLIDLLLKNRYINQGVWPSTNGHDYLFHLVYNPASHLAHHNKMLLLHYPDRYERGFYVQRQHCMHKRMDTCKEEYKNTTFALLLKEPDLENKLLDQELQQHIQEERSRLNRESEDDYYYNSDDSYPRCSRRDLQRSRLEASIARWQLHHCRKPVYEQEWYDIVHLIRTFKCSLQEIALGLLQHPAITLDGLGSQLLALACERGYKSLIPYLLAHPQWQTPTTVGYTHAALQEDMDISTAEKLEARDLTCLRIAYQYKQLEIANLLLAHPKISMNEINWLAACGQPLLQIIFKNSEQGKAENVFKFPNVSIDLHNQSHWLNGHVICKCGHQEELQLRLQYNLQQRVTDPDYDSIVNNLRIVCEQSAHNMIDLLLKKDYQRRESLQKGTFLHIARNYQGDPNTTALLYLMDPNADIVQDNISCLHKKNDTLLKADKIIGCCYTNRTVRGRLPKYKILFSMHSIAGCFRFALPSQRFQRRLRHYRRTALYDGYKQEDMALLLKHPSIDVNTKDKHGNTPLHLACKSVTGNKYVKLLLDHKFIDVNATDQLGNMPIHLVCSQKNIANDETLRKYSDNDNVYKKTQEQSARLQKIVQMLLANNAIIHYVNHNQETPWMLAHNNGYEAVAKRIASYAKEKVIHYFTDMAPMIDEQQFQKFPRVILTLITDILIGNDWNKPKACYTWIGK